MLQRVLELAHVAGPLVHHHRVERLLAQCLHLAAALLRQYLQKLLDEQQQVVPPLAQRRQVQRDHVEAVEEVGAEVAPPHLLLEVAVGGGDDPNVHRDRLGGADRDHFPLLQHAQQLHLERGRHLAHFVEEEGAAPRRGEESLLVAHRTGEAALHVAEQLALQQALRERPAVDREERALVPRGQLVDVVCHHFLAGAALALDQHRRVGRRHVLGELEHFQEALGLADGARHPAAFPAADLLAQLLVLDADRAELAGPPQDRDQLVVGERLLDVVEGAAVHRLDGALQGGLRRHQDHRRHRVLIARGGQDIDARDLRHPHVGEHDVVRPVADLFQAGLAALGGSDLEALIAEKDPQRIEDARFIIDDEDGWLLAHATPSAMAWAGSRMVNVVPARILDST